MTDQKQSVRFETRLEHLTWRPWASDNGILASVQTLVDECAQERGRTPPAWTESLLGRKKSIAPQEASSSLPASLRLEPAERLLLVCCIGVFLVQYSQSQAMLAPFLFR